MRPITRGPSPQAEDFQNYRDAFGPLQARLGDYCSYCERRIVTQLAVEHIQPKDEDLYPDLEGRWDNYLLACVNCNSTKGHQDVRPENFYFPDRDNTLAAFKYLADGTIEPMQAGDAIALRSLALTGVNIAIRQVFDENDRLVAADRMSQRMEAWLKAKRAKDRYQTNPNHELFETIIEWALSEGFYSVWMTVFDDVPAIRARLITDFPGTARDCFDANTANITPRPNNGLTGGGKI